MRLRAALASALLIISLSVAQRARADDGDAPDIDAPPAPKVEARVAVIVLGADGEPLPSTMRATLQVSMERALGTDERLEIVDVDAQLAGRAGAAPTDVVSEARGLLSIGEELLRRGQADAALAKLQAASAQLATVLAWAQKQELARAQFLLGAAQAVGGDGKAALASFIALLAWRPDFVADPTIAPTEVLPIWEKAQARVLKLRGGSIEITSSPDGAMAYVDGRFVGFTPTVVEALPAATHYVTIRMHGRVRVVEAVKVSDKKEATMRVRLEATPGIDELDAAIDDLASGIGKASPAGRARAGFRALGELLNWPGKSLILMLILLTAVVGYFAFQYFEIDTKLLSSSVLDSSNIVPMKQDSVPEIKDHELTGLAIGHNLNIVIANCTACHSAKLITQNRATKEGWKSIIVWMQKTQKLWDLGENEEKIIDYLSTY